MMEDQMLELTESQAIFFMITGFVNAMICSYVFIIKPLVRRSGRL